jgi:hypothetical protein
VPCSKSRVHVEPQSIPAGLELTVPEPVPDLPTVRVFALGATEMRVKTAVAEWFWSIVSLHAAVPEQSPVQPVKVEPPAAVAANVTWVPFGKSREQVEKQSVKPPE